ncbi:multicopper oxidase [Apodospora peruviana]|uniref:Multicopper oxidase n=1 Tax=Apodospora peruviana TaxID=516989 RepID=A0AAE0MC82_9PEZI|nr:multicopper oxidase [Apodospora peruviana]
MHNPLMGTARMGQIVLTALLSSSCFASVPSGPLSPIQSRHHSKHFELTLTWQTHAPDGFAREMILTNGQFPGPLLEMDEGDEVVVVVHNKMPFNTTLHFHGIEQHLTPWSDGVPGVTQRQIQPSRSFTYKWTATNYGSYWYHAHHRGQLDDGMYGPILIHPKKQLLSPFGLIAKGDQKTLWAIEKAAANPKQVLLSDFRHFTSEEVQELTVASNLELPCYDSVLINGKGNVDCWSAEKLASLVRPDQAFLLQAANVTSMTAKGCLPLKVLTTVLSPGAPTNVSGIPPELFDVCTPTTGSKEIITIEKKSCEKVKWVALDLVATFGLLTATFSIDETPMYVYAVDGEYIEPQLVQAISLTNGDRFSVLVRLTTLGDYTMRVASTAAIQFLAAHGTLSVKSPDTKNSPPTSPRESIPYINDGGDPLSPNVTFFNQTVQKPFPPEPIPQKADKTYKLHLRLVGPGWAVNETPFPLSEDNNMGQPTLFQPPLAGIDNKNLTITTENGTWVDLVFITATIPMPAHPIHKHGNKMRMIGFGGGDFKWDSVDEAIKDVPENFNLVDPPKRDGFATPQAVTGPTWMAVRYQVTNPGAWLLHCHIQSHFLLGMSMVIRDGVDAWPVVPGEYLAMA